MNEHTKKVAALLEQKQPQAKNHDFSISANSDFVKPENLDLQAFRTEKGLMAKDVVEVVKGIYPKYDKVIHSKCEHGDEYGIRLRSDAALALLERFAPDRLIKPKRDRHKKSNRIQARLSDDLYAQTRRHLQQTGKTAQDFLEGLVRQFFQTTDVSRK